MYNFDYTNSIVNVESPNTNIDVIELYDAIKLAQSTELGIIYGRIGEGSGKVALGSGVQVGLTVKLLGNWQLKFWAGNYVAKITGGNLVGDESGGNGGDPVAYTPGVQVLLIQSSASTIVQTVTGSGVTAQDKLDIADEIMSRDVATNESVEEFMMN